MRLGEKVIDSTRFPAEQKIIEVELAENERGQFLRISENAGGRKNMVVVPAGGLPDFRDAVNKLTEKADL